MLTNHMAYLAAVLAALFRLGPKPILNFPARKSLLSRSLSCMLMNRWPNQVRKSSSSRWRSWKSRSSLTKPEQRFRALPTTVRYPGRSWSCMRDVEVTLVNPATSTMTHTIDFHAATGALGGAALMLVNPGEQAVLRWKATRAGVFVYHCAPGGSMTPLPVVSGMNGAVMVLPREGLRDKNGELLHYDRIYYIGENDFYVPRGEGGRYRMTGRSASPTSYSRPRPSGRTATGPLTWPAPPLSRRSRMRWTGATSPTCSEVTGFAVPPQDLARGREALAATTA
jgi:FtsP/CotA-like multicopper oxidase with cupredoxin domain